ncbi:peroxiredoxin-like family protein [Hymenobacter rubripertinctus]|uniref:thioredoxin-dependent peroxiredoxin n=1 Tax=Hymenobacter rubripertinctus TaxID=2029981 RepID=A0A418QPM7_9BACT|nr:peroxiredoxin-like family protein [Hymenobacter rubripertinctus]RIY07153.1 AhpC/TSA family protein [Hymenobacter rubripertinctus]
MYSVLRAACGLLLAPLAVSAQTAPLSASPLKVGESAPAFAAKDANGQSVELSKLLRKGPVVLYFYRGQWCPYCNKQLSQLQDSLQMLTAKGAQVVVVSPETQDNIGKTVDKTSATFPILHDQDFAIMKAYRTAFSVDAATARKYQGFGLDLRAANGASQDVLPVPATYVIGRNGKIKFVYFNPDYRQRVSVKQVAQAL